MIDNNVGRLLVIIIILLEQINFSNQFDQCFQLTCQPVLSNVDSPNQGSSESANNIKCFKIDDSNNSVEIQNCDCQLGFSTILQSLGTMLQPSSIQSISTAQCIKKTEVDSADQQKKKNNQLAYPGQACHANSDCYSQNCQNYNFCFGKQLDEPCDPETYQFCNPGFYCQPEKGTCQKLVSQNQRCSRDIECYFNYFCHQQQKICVPYFSIKGSLTSTENNQQVENQLYLNPGFNFKCESLFADKFGNCININRFNNIIDSQLKICNTDQDCDNSLLIKSQCICVKINNTLQQNTHIKYCQILPNYQILQVATLLAKEIIIKGNMCPAELKLSSNCSSIKKELEYYNQVINIFYYYNVIQKNETCIASGLLWKPLKNYLTTISQTLSFYQNLSGQFNLTNSSKSSTNNILPRNNDEDLYAHNNDSITIYYFMLLAGLFLAGLIYCIKKRRDQKRQEQEGSVDQTNSNQDSNINQQNILIPSKQLNLESNNQNSNSGGGGGSGGGAQGSGGGGASSSAAQQHYQMQQKQQIQQFDLENFDQENNDRNNINKYIEKMVTTKSNPEIAHHQLQNSDLETSQDKNIVSFEGLDDKLSREKHNTDNQFEQQNDDQSYNNAFNLEGEGQDEQGSGRLSGRRPKRIKKKNSKKVVDKNYESINSQ